jgi:hypothetical protein
VWQKKFAAKDTVVVVDCVLIDGSVSRGDHKQATSRGIISIWKLLKVSRWQLHYYLQREEEEQEAPAPPTKTSHIKNKQTSLQWIGMVMVTHATSTAEMTT